MPGISIEAVVKPWYRQFYVRRGEADWQSDRISDDGYERGLEAVNGFVYVGTTMYGNPTRVRILVHDGNPGPPDRAVERVVDARLHGAGDIAVLNWDPGEDPVAVVPVPDGSLHIRMSWFGMNDAAAHPDWDLGGDALLREHLTLDVWPVDK